MTDDADVVERLLRRAAERRGGLRTFVAKRPQAEQIRKRSVANAELDERAAAEIERLRSTLHRLLSRYDRLDDRDPLYMIKEEIEAIRATTTTKGSQ